jgi:hypothetical protein
VNGIQKGMATFVPKMSGRNQTENFGGDVAKGMNGRP